MMARSLVGLVLLAAASGCVFFGGVDIPCNGPANCPTGLVCVEQICRDPEQAGLLPNQRPAACRGDDCCETPPCWLIADSSTFCMDDGGQLSTPPPPEHPFYGQDCSYQLFSPDPVDDTADGTFGDLPIVRDRVTGLAWLQEVDLDRGYPGELEARCENWDRYYDGAWRLPSFQEQISIVDHGRVHPALDSAHFLLPNDGLNFMFTTSGPAQRKAVVHVDEGSFELRSEATEARVRCVDGDRRGCGDQRADGAQFVDLFTGLSWTRDEAGPLSWREALAHCQTLQLEGHGDWRLPSAKALATVVDHSFMDGNPRICSPLGRELWSGTVWTSTPYAVAAQRQAWALDPAEGSLIWQPLSSALYLRCVRGWTAPE